MKTVRWFVVAILVCMTSVALAQNPKPGQKFGAHAKAFDANNVQVSAASLIWSTDKPDVLNVPPPPMRIGADIVVTAGQPGTALLFAQDPVTAKTGGTIVTVEGAGPTPTPVKINRIDVTVDPPVDAAGAAAAVKPK